MLPTPVAKDDGKSPAAHMAMKARMPGGARNTITSLAVLARNDFRQADGSQAWPTPTARDHKDTGENTDYQRIADRSGLAGVVQVREPSWPTPVARDAQSYLKVKRGSGSQESGMERIPPLAVAVSPDGPPANGGQLNPTWVEWLMGFPLGWTVCEAWETRSSRRSRNGSGGA